MKIQTAALACLAATVVLAIDFPDVDGSHDLASAAAWGGELPSPSETVAVTGRTQTVCFSRDVSFGMLQNMLAYGTHQTLTFDQTAYPNVWIRVKGYQHQGTNQSKAHAHFKGGKWDFGGNYFITANSSASYGNERTVTISDGAFMTNISRIALGYTKQAHLTLDIGGNSKVYDAGTFRFTNGGDTFNSDNHLVLHDGALLDVGGNFDWDAVNGTVASTADVTGYRDTVVISNATLRSRGNYFYVAPMGKSLLHVCAGGRLEAKSVIAWMYSTISNTIIVADGGEMVGNVFYGGWTTGATLPDYGHRVEVHDGGRVDFGAFYLSYNGVNGATLVVSNGFFRTAGNCGVSKTAKGIKYILQGSRTQFLPYDGSANAYMDASYGEVVMDDGFEWTPPCWPSYTSHDTSNITFRVMRGAKLDTSNMFGNYGSVKGESSSELLFRGNRLLVENGGRVEGPTLMCGGQDGELRVADSSVTLTGKDGYIYDLDIGYTALWGGWGTNCTLTIAGSCPQIATTTGVRVQHGSRLVYELPAAGYAEGVVPLTTEGAIVVNASEGASLVLEGAAEMLADHLARRQSATYVLAENPSEKGFFSNTIVATVADTLPERVRLEKRTKDGRNQLILSIRCPKGTVLNLR